MDDKVAKEDVCWEYQSSLEHLTLTCELHITMLTSLARENLPFARDIGTIIEARISKAPSSEKLPLLYLVDSIVKKVGGEYLVVFAKNLANTFQCVYEKVDENMREQLFNLRTTWDNVFPPKQLHALDVQVNNLNPDWPIKPLLPTADSSIHVNPLKRSEEASSLRAISPQLAASTTHPVPVQVPVVGDAGLLRRQLIWQQLPAMHKQPLEQQKEIEQLQTKAQMAISKISQDDFLTAAEEGEREWNLPQTVCQYYDEREVQKNYYNIPRRFKPHPQGHCEGGKPVHFDESSQYNIPHQQGPSRHDHGGLPMYNMPERFNGPGWYAPSTLHGPMGGQEVIQGPPDAFDNNIAPKPENRPMDFLQQQSWMYFDCAMSQMGSMRFEGPRPMQICPGQPEPRFYMPNVPPHYNCFPSQQGPSRYTPPQNMQPFMRPLGPSIYNNPYPPQQNFNMVGHSLSGPLNLNPQLPVESLAFLAQQTPAPFSQLATGPFYSPAAPQGGMQQQLINMMPNLNQAFLPQNPVPVTQPASQLVPPESHLVQVNINHLLSRLISTGIIPAIKPAKLDEDTSSSTAAVGPVEREERGKVEEDVPDLTSFRKEDLKQRYNSVVNELHTGSQCSSCGMRFPTDQSNAYANHLDWHYRQNRSKKDSRNTPHRHWYRSLTDWIMSDDTVELEEQMRQKAEGEKELQSVQAASHVGQEECQICHEVFEMYWAETEEEWRLNNTIMVDSKLYHPICYEDHKNVNT